MATNVKDAALFLGALVGDTPACDPPSAGCAKSDYTKGLVPTALNGKRIGVLRFDPPGRNAYVTPVYDRALAHLKDGGATLVEIKLPNLPGLDEAEELGAACRVQSRPQRVSGRFARQDRRSLAGAADRIQQKTPAELALFGQDTFEKANAMPPLSDTKYMTARADWQATRRRRRHPEDAGRKQTRLDRRAEHGRRAARGFDQRHSLCLAPSRPCPRWPAIRISRCPWVS